MSNALDDLKSRCLSCNACKLCATRTNVVFGEGPADAKIMFVGEGPGADEDEQGRPFVGKSGRLLEQYMAAAGFSRYENVYIANMVKCRPPENRDPSEEETDACLPWLRGQFKCLRPGLIVCVGRISAQKLISPDFRITKQHGEFFEKNGTLMTATLHPAALLRDPRKKGEALLDFMKIRKMAEEKGLV